MPIPTKQVRHVGRPRRDGRPPISRVQILKVAARLFAAEGYAGTSMRQICKELGVVPSSVFYQFGTKRSILEAIVAAGSESEFAYYAQLSATRARAAIQLYRIITADVSHIARIDQTLKKIIGLPELRNPRFKKLYRHRLRTLQHFTSLLQQGIDEGDFREMNTTIAGEVVVLLSELPAYAARSLGKPDALAQELAYFVFSGLLRSGQRLAAIRNAALALPRDQFDPNWLLA